MAIALPASIGRSKVSALTTLVISKFEQRLQQCSNAWCKVLTLVVAAAEMWL